MIEQLPDNVESTCDRNRFGHLGGRKDAVLGKEFCDGGELAREFQSRFDRAYHSPLGPTAHAPDLIGRYFYGGVGIDVFDAVVDR